MELEGEKKERREKGVTVFPDYIASKHIWNEFQAETFNPLITRKGKRG